MQRNFVQILSGKIRRIIMIKLKQACKICKKVSKLNVGYPSVPCCPDCYANPKGYNKFLRWLYVKNPHNYKREVAKRNVRFKDN